MQDVEGLFLDALERHRKGDLESAKTIYVQILELDGTHIPSIANLGLILVQLGESSPEALQQGISLLERGLELSPNQPHAHNSLANAYLHRHAWDKAEQHYLKAIELKPDLVDPYLNYASLILQLRDCERAKSLLLKQDGRFKFHPRFNLLLGALFLDLGKPEAALVYFDRVIQLVSSDVAAWYNRGNALRLLGRHAEAVSSYRKALRIQPTHVESLINLGVGYMDMAQFELACQHFEQALVLRPESETALFNLGLVMENQRQYIQALKVYDQLYSINQNYPYLLGRRFNVRNMVCNWDGFVDQREQIIDSVKRGGDSTIPFSLLTITDDLGLQLQAAQKFSAKFLVSSKSLSDYTVKASKPKIRVGYFSPDFKTHPIAFLLAGLFEHHDREQFEIFAFDIGNAKPNDPYSKRIRDAVDVFFEASHLSDSELVALVREKKLDIAVDLAGHTLGARTVLFVEGFAPIQVNYIGYPGSMGMGGFTHIIADETVIPNQYEKNYSEQVVRLPNTFQINDRDRKIGEIKDRISYGLPVSGLVLASFNTSNKINPEVFDIWCEIFREDSHAVLWLLGETEEQKRNLCKEFVARGLNPERLIFAERMPYEEHLARYAHVDLVLDTFPFNGGTSTSDALWGGAPVLTCMGQAFASRMSASLLKAVGLPELITESLLEYRALGLDMVRSPDRLKELKQRLANTRDTCALFDTELITRDIENAYKEMVRSLKPVA